MLTTQQQAILTLERRRYVHAGMKDEAILALGMSPTRYYQLLNALIDTHPALAADPLLVKRLRCLRDARRCRRAGVG